VDLVVTSPPYFVGKEYDTSINVADFVTELRRTIPGIVASLKNGGSVCWQVGNHVNKGRLTPLDAIIVGELASHPDLILRNRIIWTFGHGSHAASRYSGRHETVLWYTKGKDYFFNLDASRVPQLYPGKRHYKGPRKGEWSGNPLGKNPGDVWDLGDVWGIPNVKAHHIEKTEHPCQFPTALARRLIVGLSPLGGLVVDPYLGAGSAAIAALVEGRNFGGSDIEVRYLQMAATRLGSLVEGNLKLREDTPVRRPRSSEKVTQLPPHFAHALVGTK
jgi:adenine-specific DNA-methyltransferase